MAQDINNVVLSGTLADEPDLRYTKGDTAVLNLRLEVQDHYKNNGEWQTSSSWFSAVVWGKRAENMANKYQENDRIWIKGELDVNSWEQNGETQYKTEINVNDFGTIEQAGAPEAQTDPSPRPSNQSRQPQAQGQQSQQNDQTFEPDDELPF